MEMVKVKTAELIRNALNWAVAKSEGKNITLMRNDDGSLFPQPVWADGLWQQNYSTSWAQGGPIVERESICVNRRHQCDPAYCPIIDPLVCWIANDTAGGYLSYGPTPLVAAMRCYVASKLGEEVEVPKELL